MRLVAAAAYPSMRITKSFISEMLKCAKISQLS